MVPLPLNIMSENVHLSSTQPSESVNLIFLCSLKCLGDEMFFCMTKLHQLRSAATNAGSQMGRF